ncbi:glycoside hydrolase family 32 protein [Geodermatophilus sp. SYSU D00691]
MPAARPRLHFTAASGWINDPLGLTHRDGTYHLWFQHVPGSAEWGPACSWGYATSPDLLTWSEGAIALAPGEGDGGCWSGSVVTGADGGLRLFYTSVAEPDLGVGRVRTARPADAALTAWRKDPGTAVELPPGVRARQFRDPSVFAEDGRWWMLVGAGLDDGTATALTYASDDLVSWRYVGPLAARHRDETDPVWTGAMWECPQLLRVGDRHLLVVSVWDDGELHSVACAVGRFAEGRFTAASWHRIGWGSAHYAASAFRDRDGRPGLVFWLRGIADPAGGWTGATSLPYLLGLDGDRPVLTPHDAVAARRTAPQPAAALEAVWRPGAGGEELHLADADGGPPLARLRWDGDRVVVAGAALPHAGGELRLVLDGPVLEVCGPAGVLAVPVAGGSGAARPVGAGDLTWWTLR